MTPDRARPGTCRVPILHVPGAELAGDRSTRHRGRWYPAALDPAESRTLPDNVWNDTRPPRLSGSRQRRRVGHLRPAGLPERGARRGGQPTRRSRHLVERSGRRRGPRLHELRRSAGPGLLHIGGTSEATPLFSGVVATCAEGRAPPRTAELHVVRLGGPGAPGLVDVTTGDNTVSFVQGGKTYTVRGYSGGPGLRPRERARHDRRGEARARAGRWVASLARPCSSDPSPDDGIRRVIVMASEPSREEK